MKPARLLVVGASAGGVEALLTLYSHLPVTFNWPVVTVLHVPENHRSQLSQVFERRLLRRCKEAQDKEAIVAGLFYFAGPGYHLSVEQDATFSLSQEARVHYSRPAIDLLFESAADAFGRALVGVLLTGANEDGARGLAYIHRMGGLSIVQDPAEARIRVMPDAALARHTPDHILPLREIAALLATLEAQP